MEFLDIVDEQGNPTGEQRERSEVHAKGLRHRTSHVWILRRKNECVEILLQKRAPGKESFPGCFDISSAGHIPAGSGFLESAIRELEEELESVCWIDYEKCIYMVKNNLFPHSIVLEELEMLKIW